MDSRSILQPRKWCGKQKPGSGEDRRPLGHPKWPPCSDVVGDRHEQIIEKKKVIYVDNNKDPSIKCELFRGKRNETLKFLQLRGTATIRRWFRRSRLPILSLSFQEQAGGQREVVLGDSTMIRKTGEAAESRPLHWNAHVRRTARRMVKNSPSVT